MKYVIKQTETDINVFDEKGLVLIIKTKLFFSGKFQLEFYYQGEFVLSTSYFMIGFWKIIRIHYQKLPYQVSLKSSWFKNIMIVNNDNYTLKWNYLKSLTCIVKKNGTPVATLYTKKTLKWYFSNSNTGDTFFNVNDSTEKNDFLCLLRLLIEYPTFYS